MRGGERERGSEREQRGSREGEGAEWRKDEEVWPTGS